MVGAVFFFELLLLVADGTGSGFPEAKASEDLQVRKILSNLDRTTTAIKQFMTTHIS